MSNKQKPSDCEWCGKFVVLVESGSASVPWRPFEAVRDEQDRLLQAYDGTLIFGWEHQCKARCSSCGALVIIESGKLFERLENNHGVQQRRAHACRA